jgi:hypothetical protein
MHFVRHDGGPVSLLKVWVAHGKESGTSCFRGGRQRFVVTSEQHRFGATECDLLDFRLDQAKCLFGVGKAALGPVGEVVRGGRSKTVEEPSCQLGSSMGRVGVGGKRRQPLVGSGQLGIGPAAGDDADRARCSHRAE